MSCLFLKEDCCASLCLILEVKCSEVTCLFLKEDCYELLRLICSEVSCLGRTSARNWLASARSQPASLICSPVGSRLTWPSMEPMASRQNQSIYLRTGRQPMAAITAMPWNLTRFQAPRWQMQKRQRRSLAIITIIWLRWYGYRGDIVSDIDSVG